MGAGAGLCRTVEAVLNGVFKQKAGVKVNSRFRFIADHVGAWSPGAPPYALRPNRFSDIGGNRF